MYEEDQALVRLLCQGDEAAYRRFFDAYARRLAAFVQRRMGGDQFAVEDVVQNAFIRAVRGLPQYRGQASLYTWLCAVARSEIVDELRRRGRSPRTLSLDGSTGVAALVETLHPVDDPQGPRHAESADSLERVARVLAQLPARFAVALEGKYGDELSVRELSRQLGQSEAATQSLLARARDAFIKAWEADGQVPPVESAGFDAGPTDT
ncbi:MAG: RNA polymerase sigma factor [Gammaproteobacteria bacterium]|nr:RNA polymerase sigma factor [Gammaproteobacteria bacterium]MDE2250641.1 RNA polymerase sigma factor [Gammaproteobacteria bacterium]